MITKEQASLGTKSKERVWEERHVEDALKMVEELIKRDMEDGRTGHYLTRGTDWGSIPITENEFLLLREKLVEYGYDLEDMAYSKSPSDFVIIKWK